MPDLPPPPHKLTEIFDRVPGRWTLSTSRVDAWWAERADGVRLLVEQGVGLNANKVFVRFCYPERYGRFGRDVDWADVVGDAAPAPVRLNLGKPADDLAPKLVRNLLAPVADAWARIRRAQAGEEERQREAQEYVEALARTVGRAPVRNGPSDADGLRFPIHRPLPCTGRLVVRPDLTVDVALEGVPPALAAEIAALLARHRDDAGARAEAPPTVAVDPMAVLTHVAGGGAPDAPRLPPGLTAAEIGTYALLDVPRDADELAKTLGVTRGGAHQRLKRLVDRGLARTVPGTWPRKYVRSSGDEP